MQKYDLRARFRRSNPSKRDIGLPDVKTLGISNLVKDLVPGYPNHIWSSDFTYLNFHNVWIYVATIKDNFTKQILSWSVSYNHSTELVTDAYDKAVLIYGTPKYLHSDQGSEYRATTYLFRCRLAGIQISMSAKGCPYENGYQESYYNYFKLELGNINRFQTTQNLVNAMGRQIYYYNYQRIHSVIKTTPNLFRQEYYQKQNQKMNDFELISN
jgi:putative transposase